eukprot:Gb_32140 [translate_table: standard]
MTLLHWYGRNLFACIDQATQLAGKAERTEIDNLQFQVGLFGTNHHGSYGIYELDSDGSHGYDTVQTHHRIGTVPSIDSEIASELLNPATQNHGHSGMDDEPAERSPDNSSIRSPTQSRSKPLAVDLSDSASIDPDESDSQSGGELITLSRKQSQSKFGSQTCRESGIPNVALQKLQIELDFAGKHYGIYFSVDTLFKPCIYICKSKASAPNV